MMFTVLANNICPPVMDMKYPVRYVTKLSNIDTISSNVMLLFFFLKFSRLFQIDNYTVTDE